MNPFTKECLIFAFWESNEPVKEQHVASKSECARVTGDLLRSGFKVCWSVALVEAMKLG